MQLHAITLVSVTLNIFVLTEIKAKYSENIQTAGYNEYCDLEKIHCKNNQTQDCIDSVCRCRAVEGLGPDEKLVYVEEIQKCVPIAKKSDGWGCRYDVQCKESKYGLYSRCLTGKYSKLGSCECYDESSNHPVQLVDGTCTVINLSELTISSSSRTWSCNYDYQCTNSTLGRFSRCNTTTGRGTGFGACECFDTDGLKREIILIDNVCHLRKEYGQSCKFDGECNATIVGQAVCLGSPNGERIGVCKCGENFQFEPMLKECLKLGTIGSACKTDFQCQHVEALGQLSRCDGSTKKCVCWDDPGHGHMNVKFHGGQCHYARGVNQTCGEKVECILGYHANADCLIHESYNGNKVCQCPNGLSCTSNSEKIMLSTVLVLIRVMMTAFYLS